MCHHCMTSWPNLLFGAQLGSLCLQEPAPQEASSHICYRMMKSKEKHPNLTGVERFVFPA